MSWCLQSIFRNFKVTLSSKKKEVVDNWWCCHGCWCFSAVNVSDQNKPAFYNTIPCNITSLPIICPLWVSSQKHLTENAIVSQTRAQHTHTHTNATHTNAHNAIVSWLSYTHAGARSSELAHALASATPHCLLLFMLRWLSVCSCVYHTLLHWNSRSVLHVL